MNNLKHEIDSSNYDICPYCGEKMVAFACGYCNSRTPSIELVPMHLNMDTIKKSMYEYIHVPEEEEDYKND